MDVDQIYVINLPEAAERRQWMLWQLDKAGLSPYTVWNATRGRDLARDAVMQLVDTTGFQRRYGREISSGEAACTLSHLGVCRDILDKGYRHGLVLEDDALLSPRLRTILPKFSRFLETTAPILLVLTALRRYRRWPRRKIGDGLSLVKVDSAWRGHGYMLNRPAAERIARLQSPVTCLCDDWRALSATAGLELWGLNHYVIGLSLLSNESSLDQDRQAALSSKRSAEGARNGTLMRDIRNRCLRAIGFMRTQPHPW